MIKKIFSVFIRNLKSSFRDVMAMYIIVMPIILAIVITLFAPGLNDTTVNVAMLSDADAEHIEFMQQYAKVELFDSVEDIERRVNKRDEIAGIAPTSAGSEIILQGNENEVVGQFAVALNTLYESGASKDESSATMLSFGKEVPPLKTKLVNMLISMTIMLAGMLIAIGIVEEKTDNTINALNVTPLSQSGFVIGKSMVSGLVAMVSIIVALLITGYYDINWFMIILVGFTSLFLSLIVGFVQGLASDDVIEAAANVKMIMLPIAGSIAIYELAPAGWQWTAYWSPFYWAYKANDMILTKLADWPTVLLCTGMVVVLSAVVYIVSLPKIRKGLS